MPETKARSRASFLGALIVIVVAAGALALWYTNNRGGTGSVEGFQAFSNLTRFSDDQVWEAYRFAVANPSHVMDYTPCFCGCVSHGDTNKRDCYMDGFDGQGRLVFDPHAAG